MDVAKTMASQVMQSFDHCIPVERIESGVWKYRARKKLLVSNKLQVFGTGLHYLKGWHRGCFKRCVSSTYEPNAVSRGSLTGF